MNQQEYFDRLESAYENYCARMDAQYLNSLEEGEELSDIEQEFWGELNFNDISSALADEEAIDGKAFVRAMQQGDTDKVFHMLQDAIQIYVEQRARKERELSLWEAEGLEELEREDAEREWRMR